MTDPPGWDPVARDSHGAPLSAGEVCQRDDCWHRWLDHAHLVELDAPEFGWCTIRVDRGRCSCRGFVGADVPWVAPSPFAAPFPGEPPCGRHERAEELRQR